MAHSELSVSGGSGEPLRLVYCDERIVVVDKPPGLLVHRVANGSSEPALLQILRDQLGRRIHPVHRLDQMASGLLAYGLDKAAAAALQRGLQSADACKEYSVLVCGIVPEQIHCRLPLLDDKGVERPAATDFFRQTLFLRQRLTLLSAHLHSGRFHQIRRHLASLGHHVLGDRRYGQSRANRLAKRLGLERMFLHAARLVLRHPDGRQLQVSAALADDLEVFLTAIVAREQRPGKGSGESTRLANPRSAP